MNLKFVILATYTCLAGLSAEASCFKLRAVIEFGSGNTKALIAKVNTCVTPNVFTPIAHLEAPVQYRNYTEVRNGSRYLSEQIMNEGIGATEQLLSQIAVFGVEHVQAVATSVFRDEAIDANGTANGRAFLNSLSDRFNLKITVLSQLQEATIAAEAAVSEVSRTIPNFRREDSIIWDIGGGSTQIVLPGETTGEYAGFYLGGYGSATVQEYVNTVLKNITDDVGCSANPVDLTQVDQIYDHIRARIRAKVSPELVGLINQRNTVIGIGGVHKYSNCELIFGAPNCNYTANDLYNAIQTYAGLTDQELYEQGRCAEFKYCRDKITNAALIYTILKSMDKSLVQTATATPKEGVMVTPGFWSDED